jgi:excisionase family DNA binding protein
MHDSVQLSREPLISTRELARLLDVSRSTVYGWQTRRVGPPAYQVGRHTRYRPSEVMDWLDERRREGRR